jgi:hypothetical protein
MVDLTSEARGTIDLSFFCSKHSSFYLTCALATRLSIEVSVATTRVLCLYLGPDGVVVACMVEITVPMVFCSTDSWP